MKVTINNDVIIVEDPTDHVRDAISNELTYTDKSKQYQLKRMAKNAWSRNSPLYKKLQKEVDGKLYKVEGNSIVFSSAMLSHFSNLFVGAEIVDNRKETGKVVPLPWTNKPHDLRPYQEEAVDLMLSNPRGVINLATGLGKSLITVHFVKRYRRRALIVCPSESVAKQFYDMFVHCFGQNKVGFYGGGKRKINDITIGIAASVTKAIEEFKNAELGAVVIDETHHTPATTFFSIAEGLASVGKMFGLTATDYRSDGKDIMITAGCGPVLIRRDIKWGVENGFLAEPYFLVREVDTGGRDFKDDKLKSYKEHVLNNQAMKSRIESDARSMMQAGKSVLVLVDEVAHGVELSNKLGIPFATGEDKKSQEYVDQLNNGEIGGLIGTDGKIGEGSDTRNVDVLILANFIASKGPVIQCVGRALRKQGSKTKALILDYVPMGSSMMKRHAMRRLSFYREITSNVKYVRLKDAQG
ncbi:MAG: DEAD/DEAH box helicase [Candidatus Caldarchaeum sp.]